MTRTQSSSPFSRLPNSVHQIDGTSHSDTPNDSSVPANDPKPTFFTTVKGSDDSTPTSSTIAKVCRAASIFSMGSIPGWLVVGITLLTLCGLGILCPPLGTGLLATLFALSFILPCGGWIGFGNLAHKLDA